MTREENSGKEFKGAFLKKETVHRYSMNNLIQRVRKMNPNKGSHSKYMGFQVLKQAISFPIMKTSSSQLER